MISAPSSVSCAICGASAAKWARQNIGEDEIVRAARAQFRVGRAIRQHRIDEGADAVAPRVLGRRRHRHGIDVAGLNGALEAFGGSDGENAGPRADVEDGARTPPPRDAIEHFEAAARRAVMAGAEGERGVDLDCDVVGAHFAAAVRSMHDEAPGPHRLQPFERGGHPVLGVDAPEARPRRDLFARDGGDQRAEVFLIGRGAEKGLDQPRATLPVFGRGRLLEGGDGGLGGIEGLDDDVGNDARDRLVTGEAHDVGGVVGRQAFKHGRA